MAKILQSFELSDADSMAKVDIGRGWIESLLDAEGSFLGDRALEFHLEFIQRKQIYRATGN